SEDTAQGRSLHQELALYLNPRSGRVLSEHIDPVGDIGDIGDRVKTVLEAPPALMVLNGGQEAAPSLTAPNEATLDGGNRTTAGSPARLSPAATVDYSQLPTAEDVLPECLTSATGYQPGGEITEEHRAMMLNRSTDFLRTGYAY